MKDLRGKVAVVTGAGGGIGFQLARRWARAGMSVVLADFDAALLQDAAALLGGEGADVLALVADVADHASVAALADAAYRRYGNVHLLCNNAAIVGPPGKPLWELPRSEWERVMNTNFHGVVHGLQEFLPRMIASRQGGHIVTTTSMTNFSVNSDHAPYVASKNALLGLCDVLHAQLKALDCGISSSVLVPGYTRTNIFARERGLEAGTPGVDDQIVAQSGEAQIAMDPTETAEIVYQAVVRGDYWIFPNDTSLDRIIRKMEPIVRAAQFYCRDRPAPQGNR